MFAGKRSAAHAPNPPGTDELLQLETRLLSMTPEQRAVELSNIGQAERQSLTSSEQFVDKMSAALPAKEFAKVATQLMVRVPEMVDQPVSARREAQSQLSRMLQNPPIAARMLKQGNRGVVVPKNVPMTALPE